MGVVDRGLGFEMEMMTESDVRRARLNGDGRSPPEEYCGQRGSWWELVRAGDRRIWRGTPVGHWSWRVGGVGLG